MPIVDGLTSTKMIRSFEKSHPTHLLSSRASLNRRVPIIAVSASLVEKERHVYIDAGFDGWILKPISFNRLIDIMTGIVDERVREDNLYKPGGWEHGGWFDEAQKDIFAANTKPSEKPRMTAPGASVPSERVRVAAATDNPFVKEETESEQTREQNRLAEEQEKGRTDQNPPKASTWPEFRAVDRKEEPKSSDETIVARPTAGPQSITPDLEDR